MYNGSSICVTYTHIECSEISFVQHLPPSFASSQNIARNMIVISMCSNFFEILNAPPYQEYEAAVIEFLQDCGNISPAAMEVGNPEVNPE